MTLWSQRLLCRASQQTHRRASSNNYRPHPRCSAVAGRVSVAACLSTSHLQHSCVTHRRRAWAHTSARRSDLALTIWSNTARAGPTARSRSAMLAASRRQRRVQVQQAKRRLALSKPSVPISLVLQQHGVRALRESPVATARVVVSVIPAVEAPLAITAQRRWTAAIGRTRPVGEARASSSGVIINLAIDAWRRALYRGGCCDVRSDESDSTGPTAILLLKDLASGALDALREDRHRGGDGGGRCGASARERGTPRMTDPPRAERAQYLEVKDDRLDTLALHGRSSRAS